MAVTEHASGTQASTLDTEHFLGTDPEATDGVYQFVVAVNNMARGDRLEITVYEAPLSADVTSELVQRWVLNNEQFEDLWMSPSLILLHRWRFSIQQTDGTARSYRWSIRRVA